MAGNDELQLIKLAMKGMVSELSEESKAVFDKESKKFDQILSDIKAKVANENEESAAVVIAGMIFLSEFGQLIESKAGEKL